MESSYKRKSSLNKNLFSQQETGYSSHSIIQCMENFLEAVHEMDDTILVPSRLMGMKIEKCAHRKCESCCKLACSLLVIEMLGNFTDLFALYSVICNLKNQLQWGSKDQRPMNCAAGCEDGTVTSAIQCSSTNVLLNLAPLISPLAKGHIRRPSTVSMSSTNSSAASSVISEADSESSIENDSGIDAELESCIKSSSHESLEQNFNMYLRGLSDTLKQLTEAARFVTKRYQEVVLGVID